jgi:hypothetical protein
MVASYRWGLVLALFVVYPPSFFSIWYLAVVIDRPSFGTWWRSIVADNIITTLIISGGSMRVGDIVSISVSFASILCIVMWIS